MEAVWPKEHSGRVMPPGAVESQSLRIIRFRAPDQTLKPGQYSARAVCTCCRAPEGQELTVETEPFLVTISERGWPVSRGSVFRCVTLIA
jgi:hypothetical protein